MVDIKGLLMFIGVFKRRAVVFLVLFPLLVTGGLAAAINLFAFG
jgi:hypothetical protein